MSVRFRRYFKDNIDFDMDFKKIIEKMIYSDPVKRYQNISGLVIDINKRFKTICTT